MFVARDVLQQRFEIAAIPIVRNEEYVLNGKTELPYLFVHFPPSRFHLRIRVHDDPDSLACVMPALDSRLGRGQVRRAASDGIRLDLHDSHVVEQAVHELLVAFSLDEDRYRRHRHLISMPRLRQWSNFGKSYPYATTASSLFLAST